MSPLFTIEVKCGAEIISAGTTQEYVFYRIPAVKYTDLIKNLFTTNEPLCDVEKFEGTFSSVSLISGLNPVLSKLSIDTTNSMSKNSVQMKGSS